VASDLEVFRWIVFAAGVAGALACVSVVVAGAFVERIAWVDRALTLGLMFWGVCTFALALLERATGPLSSGMYLWEVLGLGVGAGLGVFTLVSVLIVARVRRRRGWVTSISGAPTPQNDGIERHP
jgi:hypothetical protein